jgi:tetratricopeptide (TPR) repeat protein/predicted aspartyl protease
VSTSSWRALVIGIAAFTAGLPMMPAAAACKLMKTAQLKVTMEGLSPLVAVKINGVDARLIADSGAFYSMLSPGSAAQLKLKLAPVPFGFGLQGVGGDVAPSLTTVKDFTLVGVTLHDVQFLVGGSEMGHGTAGMLGQNLWANFDVDYDLANGVIRLLRPKDCGNASLAYWASGAAQSVIDIEPSRVASFHTIGAAQINGSKIRVMFDTGASTSVLSLRAAARVGVKPDGNGVVPGGYSYGVGRSFEQTWIAPFAGFKLGDEEIRNTHLRIGDIGNVSGADMLLGADFFLSHHVYVSNAQRRLYFTYNGGAVFNLTTTAVQATSKAPAAEPAPAAAPAAEPAPAAEEAPTAADMAAPHLAAAATAATAATAPEDAGALSQRGAAFAARRDFAHALADLTRACELAPQEPQYFYQRGVVRMQTNQADLALMDFDRALELDPRDQDALLARASLRLLQHDTAAARTDLDAAAAVAAREADVRFTLAVDYDRAGAPSEAVAQYDLWIAAHAEDVKLPRAYNNRCWIRALLGQDLNKAMDDCNRAVRLAPRTAGPLDSRGLVRLRQGDYAKSVTDYDAALRLQPKLAWSLYGRGIDELRLGQTSQGQADIAAATKLAPDITEQAGRYGLTP